MITGRPVKFKTVDELQAAIDEYFLNCDLNIKEIHVKDGEPYGVSDPEPYTMAGLAYAVGLSRQGLMEYKAKSDGFSDAIKKARHRVEADVERRLMRGAGVGAIFNLKNNFGWRDKSEIDNNIKFPKPIFGGNSVPGNDSDEESLPAQEED